jgi:hypothetical protein
MQKTEKYRGDTYCGECLHWQKLFKDDDDNLKLVIGHEADPRRAGECRRETPMYHHGAGRVFPVTAYNDWCYRGKAPEGKLRRWWQFWTWGR